jgi:hypothetical protein
MLKSLCECESNHTVGSIQYRHRHYCFSLTPVDSRRAHTTAGSASSFGLPRTHAHAQTHARMHACTRARVHARRPARKHVSRLTRAPRLPPRAGLASSTPQIRCKPVATAPRLLRGPSARPAAPPRPAGPTPSPCLRVGRWSYRIERQFISNRTSHAKQQGPRQEAGQKRERDSEREGRKRREGGRGSVEAGRAEGHIARVSVERASSVRHHHDWYTISP